MRHAVLGAGGVGGLLAAALSRSGEDVLLLLRPERLAGFPGHIPVESAVLGSFVADVPAAAALDREVDALWVATKATALDEALAAVPAGVVADATVVPLLNGIDHVDLLRRRYSQVCAATIRVESERTDAGLIRQPSLLLRVDLGPSAATDALARVLHTSDIPTRIWDDETSMLWDKLVFLAPIALATTAFDQPVGGIRDDARFQGCLDEVLAVARRDGAVIDEGGVRELVIGAPAQMRTSMQRDVAAGRTPELDAIAGAVVTRAERFGIPVPNTSELVAAIQSRTA